MIDGYTRAELRDALSFTEVRDSGKRQEFATGSRRDTRDGKGRYDLIPPDGLRRLAIHFENGARKYGDRNWEKGQPISRYLDSCIRHAFDYLEGKRDEDHLGAAMWNAMAAAATEERVAAGRLPAELDDVPRPGINLIAERFAVIANGNVDPLINREAKWLLREFRRRGTHVVKPRRKKGGRS